MPDVTNEIGTAIWHSESPNFRSCPFLVVDDKNQLISYTLLWPVRAVHPGDVITRDYTPLVGFTEEQREAYLCAWASDDVELKASFLKIAKEQRSRVPEPKPLDLQSLRLTGDFTPTEQTLVFSDIEHLKSQFSKQHTAASTGDASILWVSPVRASQCLDTLTKHQKIFHCPSRSLFSASGLTTLFL